MQLSLRSERVDRQGAEAVEIHLGRRVPMAKASAAAMGEDRRLLAALWHQEVASQPQRTGPNLPVQNPWLGPVASGSDVPGWSLPRP